MASREKISSLASGGSFDCEGFGKSEVVSIAKVKALGRGTAHDSCASTSSRRKTHDGEGIGNVLSSGICHSFTPDGRCVSLFKTLYTNSCSHACNYCSNSTVCKSRPQTHSYEAEELAKITLSLYEGNYIEGLFLSSGIGADEDRTMDNMLDTVRLLRKKHRFNGYIHLKILPGVSRERIKEAMELSDRVSINVESSSESRMGEMSSTKDYRNDIMQRQKYIADLLARNGRHMHSENRKPETGNWMGAGHTTQMIIGSTEENDAEIFSRMLYEYKEMRVKRVYYSSFSPACGTPFENKKEQALWRENRLYQTDWLYRVYKFTPKMISLAFDENGFLGNEDPKLLMAREFLEKPIDPNSSAYEELLLVPGIGPISARRILQARKRENLNSRVKLSRLGVVLKRAVPFLKINGFCQTTIGRFV
ncbi:radical SAM protein [Candidatus Micrarchaeota archaeon]|nr:radical SAM protein [Candidatus Micrarchaeota archaeon]